MLRSCIWTSLALLLGPSPGAAAAAGPSPGALLTQTAAVAFADHFMERHKTALQVPGAAVVIVRGEVVLMAKGYGLADVERGVPVDAAQTLFRAGSVSKLFTATAVMQLVERGAIDLHADVNRYLRRIRLDKRYARPVTAADLLLHTAGFDEVYLGMHARHAGQLQPLGTFLQRHLPERHLPPGRFISYNDHGYSLAGLLVEEMTGMPFAEYVATHILKPLGMEQSTFLQPIPTTLRRQLAVGYRVDDGDHRAYGLDLVQVSPAAGLVGPAREMAHFMIAFLNGGRYGESRILKAETVAAMQTTQFTHHPLLRGRGYGFSEWRRAGRRAVFHDGGQPGFLCRLFLLPKERTGFYLAFNADQHGPAARFHREFTRHFLEAFFPAPPEEDEEAAARTEAAPDQPLDRFAGHYQPLQGYSRDTLQKVASLAAQVSVRAEGGFLHLFGQAYQPVSDLVFRSMDERRPLVFREDAQGRVTHLFLGTAAFARLPWFSTRPVQLAGLLGFVLVFIGTVMGALLPVKLPARLSVLLVLAAVLNLVFLAGMAASLYLIDPWEFTYGPPSPVKALLWLPLFTSGLAVAAALGTAAAWRRGRLGCMARTTLLIASGAALAFPVYLNHWNLLGFQY